MHHTLSSSNLLGLPSQWLLLDAVGAQALSTCRHCLRTLPGMLTVDDPVMRCMHGHSLIIN